MPRIACELSEHATPEQKATYNKGMNGNGSSVFDVCKSCCNKMVDNGPWDDHKGKMVAYNGEPDGLPYVILKDTDHPPYDGEDCQCVICGRILIDKRDF